MSIPTLVIGLGGSGTLTVRSLKRKYLSFAESDRVPAKFLAIDFDRSAQAAVDGELEALSAGEFLLLDPEKIRDFLRNADRAESGIFAWHSILEWFPDRAKVDIPLGEVEANGAGQVRPLGRLGVFLNDAVIESRLRSHLSELAPSVDPTTMEARKRVLLTGSLAGGTGSGMFADIAYLARRQDFRPFVFAYLILPEVFRDVDHGGRIFPNAYAALKELAYLESGRGTFRAEYLNVEPLQARNGSEPPFSRIFLMREGGATGVAAIRNACVRTAEAMSGQLQPLIQAQTMAIESNPPSKELEKEGRTRGYECFGSVGTSTIDVTSSVDEPEMVLAYVVRALRNDDFLDELKISEASELLRYVDSRLNSGATSQPVRQPKLEGPHGTAAALRSHLRTEASSATKDVVDALGQGISAIETALAVENTEVQWQKFSELMERVVSVIPESYKRRVTKGKREPTGKNETLEAKKQDITRAVDGLIGTLASALSTDGAMSARAFLRKLQGLIDSQKGTSESGEDEALKSFWARVEELNDGWEKRPRKRSVVSWFDNRVPEVEAALYWRELVTEVNTRLNDKLLTRHIEQSLFDHALNTLKDTIRRHIEKLDVRLEKLKTLRDLTEDAISPGVPTRRDSKVLRDRAEVKTRNLIGRIIDQAAEEVRPLDTPIERFQVLRRTVKRIVAEQKLFVIADDAEEARTAILRALVACKPRVFERRTPDPGRRAICLVAIPEGMVWPGGDFGEWSEFLRHGAEQVLDCAAQVHVSMGERVWIYYEELFMPASHVRRIDEYFRHYSKSRAKELFHLDRRFLADPRFVEVNSGTARISLSCGNQGCSGNISGVPRSERVCPWCGNMILSRCGNDGCDHEGVGGDAEHRRKTCVACDGFNHAGWWLCCRHGATPVEIPVDEEHCPTCIAEFHAMPQSRTAFQIAARPDVARRMMCPRCLDMRESDAKHNVFNVPWALREYFENGVNGHDRQRFEILADELRLPDRVRCPECRTILIPARPDQGNTLCEQGDGV